MTFPVGLLIGVLGGVAIFVASSIRRYPLRASRRFALALLWLWAVGVIYFTFGTPSGGGQALNLKPLALTNPADVVDAMLNVLMFTLGGVAFALLSVRWFHAMLFGFLVSLTIEICQYATSSGRSADINDLASNTLGTLIGFACAAAVLARTHRSAPRSGNFPPKSRRT